MSDFYSVASTTLNIFPFLIIWTIGLLLAITKRQESPSRYLLVIIAMILFLINGFLNIIFYQLLLQMMQKMGLDLGTHHYWIFTVKKILVIILSGAGWILILLAIFKKEQLPEETVRRN